MIESYVQQLELILSIVDLSDIENNKKKYLENELQEHTTNVIEIIKNCIIQTNLLSSILKNINKKTKNKETINNKYEVIKKWVQLKKLMKIKTQYINKYLNLIKDTEIQNNKWLDTQKVISESQIELHLNNISRNKLLYDIYEKSQEIEEIENTSSTVPQMNYNEYAWQQWILYQQILQKWAFQQELASQHQWAFQH